VGGSGGRGLALLVAGAFFMENLDGTIISTAAPRMAVTFGVHPVDINAAMTAYLVTLAVLIPVSGWVADRYGARKVFAVAIAVFTAASILCAASTSLPELVAVRVLQGAGGAMMVPVGRLAVLRSTEKTDLLTAIAYLTWPALIAPVVAPALGGLFTTYASWRWIFLVNVPLGVVALALALRMVPDLREPHRTGLDWAGFLLSGVGLAAFVYGLERVGGEHVDRAAAGAALGAGAVLCAVAVRHMLRTRHPLLALRIMRIPTFRATNVGGSLFRIAISAVPFLLPLMFQDAFGWSPARSGFVVIAVFVGNVAIKPFTSPILRRFGFRGVLVGNGALTVVTFALLALLGPGTPLPLTLLALFAGGVCRSVSFTAYNTIAFADIEPERTSAANAFASTVQQLTVGMGVAVGALALRTADPLLSLVGRHGPAAPYHLAFLLLGLLPLAAVVESLRLSRDAGAVVTGAGRRQSRPEEAR
jgi:EmrB/QacA subfamily drug resistance transporter